jgi:hypothetical protein
MSHLHREARGFELLTSLGSNLSARWGPDRMNGSDVSCGFF